MIWPLPFSFAALGLFFKRFRRTAKFVALGSLAIIGVLSVSMGVREEISRWHQQAIKVEAADPAERTNVSSALSEPAVPARANEKPVQAPPGPLQASIKAAVSGDMQPVIEGETNLPDDTELVITVAEASQGYQGQLNSIVVGARFRAGPFSQSGKNLPPGEYSVEVLMAVPSVQPEKVRQVIGERGENLAGSLVQKGEAGAVVRGVMTIKIGGGAPKQDTQSSGCGHDRAGPGL